MRGSGSSCSDPSVLIIIWVRIFVRVVRCDAPTTNAKDGVKRFFIVDHVDVVDLGARFAWFVFDFTTAVPCVF